MPEPLFDLSTGHILRKPCQWCKRRAPYDDGTKCMHGDPPTDCELHGRWTDLNLVTRGRRAVVKCTHHGNAFVVLYADPMSDESRWGTYTVQFAAVGVGSELYTIKPQIDVCPHMVYDKLVQEMRDGARPSANRVPPPVSHITEPGKGYANNGR